MMRDAAELLILTASRRLFCIDQGELSRPLLFFSFRFPPLGWDTGFTCLTLAEILYHVRPIILMKRGNGLSAAVHRRDESFTSNVCSPLTLTRVKGNQILISWELGNE